jgi:hypothetical protein
MERTKEMQVMVDSFTTAVYGKSNTEAVAQGACLSCGKVYTAEEQAEWSFLDRKEFGISATCPTCWDAIFGDDEDQYDLDCNGDLA